jgi:N-methylhydantoinase A
VRHDFVRTLNRPLAHIDANEVDAVFAEQVAAGRALLARERVEVERVNLLHEVDLLYRGQSHVIRIEVKSPGFDPARVLADFIGYYNDRFGISLPEMVPMLVNARSTVLGIRQPTDLRLFRPKQGGSAVEAQSGERRVYFAGGWHTTKIYRRQRLPVGAYLQGPSIVEQLDSTLVLDPGSEARVDELGNLIVMVGSGGGST